MQPESPRLHFSFAIDLWGLEEKRRWFKQKGDAEASDKVFDVVKVQ